MTIEDLRQHDDMEELPFPDGEGKRRRKGSVADLAVFGGPSLFSEPVHVGRPNIGDRESFLLRVNDLLDRRWLSNNGPYVQEFEQRIAALVGVEHCIAMCNATVGLEIAIRALGLRDEVIVPSMTFVATAHALKWQGITPVFCDVDPLTYTLDPARVEELITPRTTGIIGVHLWGRACNVDALGDTAERHGVKLLYDAAHAFSCTHNGRMIGGFGDAEVFSFHATKFLNSMEGGAVVTNDAKLAAKVRLMKNFGFTGYDDVVDIGVNGKMTEVSAAMGLTSLESLDTFIAVNQRNYLEYGRQLSRTPGIRLLPVDEDAQSNYQYVVVEIDVETAGISRDQVLQVCWAEQVLARRYFYPGCHRMEPYGSLWPDAEARLPITEYALDRVLQLPTGTALGKDDVSDVCNLLRFVLLHGQEVSVLMDERHPPGSVLLIP